MVSTAVSNFAYAFYFDTLIVSRGVYNDEDNDYKAYVLFGLPML